MFIKRAKNKRKLLGEFPLVEAMIQGIMALSLLMSLL